jgi:MFS family permease
MRSQPDEKPNHSLDSRTLATGGASCDDPGKLSASAAFRSISCVIGAVLFASSVPTSLYGLYQQQWHFSSLVLTLIYAAYAISALVGLLLFGSVSDDIGRRSALLAGLGGLIVATGIFAAAESTLWLFIARCLQGLATGVTLAAAGAGLVDFQPAGDQRRAGLINGVASAAGLAMGAPIAAVLVEYAPAPRLIPFAVQAAIFFALLPAVLTTPETAKPRRSVRCRIHPPGVPSAVRGAFAVASLAVLSSWSIAGLFLSLGPHLVDHLLATTGSLPGGLTILAFAGAAAVAQIPCARISEHRITVGGSIALAAGMGLTVSSLSASTLSFFGGVVLAGAGFGVVFLGGLRTLSNAIPIQRRAEVMSAFYIAAYLSLSIPAVAAGLIVTNVGITQTFRVFGLCAIAVAVTVALAATRLSIDQSKRGAPVAHPVVAATKKG